MSDDPVIVCCILGLCCQPASAGQLAETVKMIRQRHTHLTTEKATERARRLLEKHDYFRGIAAAVDEA